MVKKAIVYIFMMCLILPFHQTTFPSQHKSQDIKTEHKLKKPWYKSVWAKATGALALIGAAAVTVYYVGKQSGSLGKQTQSSMKTHFSARAERTRNTQESQDLVARMKMPIDDPTDFRNKVQTWISAGNDINKDIIYYQGGGAYFTPVMAAAYFDNEKALELLINDFGADVNSGNGDNLTPLMTAGLFTFKYLISCGANVNARADNGWSPLLSAVMKGNYDNIKLAIEKGAQVNAQDEDGDAPLTEAYLGYVRHKPPHGKLEYYPIMEYLLEAGADPNVYIPHDIPTDATVNKGLLLIDDAKKRDDQVLVKLLSKYVKK